MLALGWVFGASLLLTLQENSLALPAAAIQSANTEHLRNNVVIDGQSPPCINNICPQLAAATLPNATIPESKTANITDAADEAPGKEVDDDSDVPTNCSSSSEHEAESDLRSVKRERLRAAYRIAGQPPPPCHNHICPLTQTTRRSAVVEDAQEVEDSTHEEVKPKHFREAFKISGANQTVPPSCLNGKVRCLSKPGAVDNEEVEDSTPEHGKPKHFREAFIISGANQTVPPSCLNGKVRCLSKSANVSEPPQKHNSSSASSACRANRTAPITCGDGTKPPCGKEHWSKDLNHHSSNETTSHFPGTHQTAPITCGDGTKPPCGKNRTTPRFPGTHQTAPITCGDGTKPPCGKNHSVEGSTPRFPGTHQTAPINCGDGTKPPCGKNHSVNGTTPRSPRTHQTAPITCGDGTKPPCGKQGSTPENNSSTNGTSTTFYPHVPVHRTAPVTCGDGTKPPCRN